jgi:hypothetical protein
MFSSKILCSDDPKLSSYKETRRKNQKKYCEMIATIVAEEYIIPEINRKAIANKEKELDDWSARLEADKKRLEIETKRYKIAKKELKKAKSHMYDEYGNNGCAIM